MPSQNEWKKDCRKAFEVVEQTPHIRPKAISKELNMRPTTAGALLKDAINQGYIFGPQLIKKSYKNFAEHIHLSICKDPYEMFKNYKGEKDVIFHAIMDGFANFRIVSRKKLDINSLIYGLRTDYLISVPPDRDWGQSTTHMRTMVQQFDLKEYTPKNYITARWNEEIEWTELDEILYNEFKYNVRRPVAHVMKKLNIQRDVIKDWFEKVPDYCTVFTSFYPETINNYEPYVYVFKTDYEDFIIEVFSELPTTVWFFKVCDNLMVYTWIDRGSMNKANCSLSEISRLHIFLVIEDLLKKEIIKSEQHAIDQCYWRA